MSMKTKILIVVLAVCGPALHEASANLMIDNADETAATWTIEGNAYSLTTVNGGVSGNARKLQANPSSGQAVFRTTAVAGNKSAYMNGSVELNYKTLGISSSANGPYTLTSGYPRYLAVHIQGGADPANQWVEFNIAIGYYAGSLEWDNSSAWHTIKLAFVDGLGSRVGSEFDGVAATTSTLPIVARGSGMTTPEGRADMWANVTSISIGNTHLFGEGPYAATAIDNLQLVPGPVPGYVIDNADNTIAIWTLEGNAYSLTTVSGGVSGNARKLQANPSSGAAVFRTTALAGDRSVYMNGSVELSYKTLGISSSANGPYTLTSGYPRYLVVHIEGGTDPNNQWVEFNIASGYYAGSLGWDNSSAWHTIKLAFVGGMGSLVGSEFDGVAATTSTLPIVAKGDGMITPAGRAGMWANVTSIYIGNTHLSGDGPYAATAIDNLQLVPGPVTVHGTVFLGDYTGDGSDHPVPVAVRVTLQGPTTIIADKILDVNGQFFIDNVPQGTYDVKVKGASWLQKMITGVTVGTTTDLGTFTLANGDTDGDNYLGPSDIVVWTANCDQSGDELSGGISDEVLPPWTPITISQTNHVQVWGREYQMANGLLPDNITTQNTYILSGPIKFTGTADGNPFNWAIESTQMVEQHPDFVSFQGSLISQGVRISGTSRIEYDGMVKVDVDVVPTTQTKLVNLVLEVPLKQQYATYLYRFPGVWGSTSNAGSLPAGTWYSAFKPYVALSNEDCGLAWFCESYKGWHPADPNQALSTVHSGDSVVLKLNLLSSVYLQPNQPVHYTFGFEAAPVKPNTSDAWDYRIMHMYGYADNATLDQWAAFGARTLVFHQNWTDIQGYYEPTDRQALRDLVSGCHARNMKLLLYFGTHMSEIDPSWNIYSTERMQKNYDTHDAPNYQMPYLRHSPDQLCWNMCENSTRSDYLAWATAYLMDEYDIDGVYLDGIAYPLPCGSEHHGCGWVEDNGTRHDTYPIYACRNLVKRLYTIVKTRKPDGEINLHNSTVIVLPTVGWGTSLWDGESIAGLSRTYFANVIPMDTFRAEYMGWQWGLPMEFLAYDTPPGPYTTSEALAFTLIHDVIVRPIGMQPTVDSTLWQVMDTFGRKQAAWLPYWNNSSYVQVTPVDVKVSIYNRQANGALFVISNLAQTAPQTAVVTPNTTALGLGSGPFSATDMMSGQPINIDNATGKITLTMQYMEWRLIKIKKQ